MRGGKRKGAGRPCKTYVMVTAGVTPATKKVLARDAFKASVSLGTVIDNLVERNERERTQIKTVAGRPLPAPFIDPGKNKKRS